jgi:signal transduction histidine kinase/ActR/RegA family two-component response regulator
MTKRERGREKTLVAESVRALYRQTPAMFVAGLAAGIVLVWMLWTHTSDPALLVWLTVLLLVMLARAALVWAYQRHDPPSERARPWGVAIVVSLAVSGITWGSTAVLFLSPEESVSLILVTVVLFGLTAGAVTAMSSYTPAYYAFAVPTMVPLIVVLLGSDVAVAVAVGWLALFVFIANIFFSRNVRELMSRSRRLDEENIELQRKTEEKTALLESTLQNLGQGVSLTDASGVLRMWNNHFEQLLQIDAESFGANPSLRTVLNSGHRPIQPALNGVTEHVREDGIIVEICTYALPEGHQLHTYRNISARKRREQALEAARTAAEKADAGKTRFLAAASHDLRQPIHALGLLFASLAVRVRDQETGPLIDKIDDSINAIDAMLNALLDISKLDAGVVQPTIGPVDMNALLRRLESEFQPLAVDNKNRLRVRPCTHTVRSDGMMLERILRNLLSNALRYTYEGKVLVGTRRRGDELVVEIHDTGMGIAPNQIEDIFLEFHQVCSHRQNRHQGLGLGLAIVQRAAKLLNHEVRVRSAPDRGSCFSVRVPLLQTGSVRPDELNPTTNGIDTKLRGLRTLVVDDDNSVLVAMGYLLRQWGCEPITASSVAEASRKVATSQAPQLLLVDYRLREPPSGLEAITFLSEMIGPDIPVLVITGDLAPERLKQIEAHGYTLLKKPVSPGTLHEAIRQLVDTHRQGEPPAD